jgi:hypothetical protein
MARTYHTGAITEYGAMGTPENSTVAVDQVTRFHAGCRKV